MMTKSCESCLPATASLAGPGLLHLRLPSPHMANSLASRLKTSGWNGQLHGARLSLEAKDADLSGLVKLLAQLVPHEERLTVRALFEPAGRVMQLDDYLEADSLECFIAKAQRDWLLGMMCEERLTSVFQPIIEVQSGEVFAYECLMRGREAQSVVCPRRLLDVARGADLLRQLDFQARCTAIEAAARCGISCKIFINFTPTTMPDPLGCLQNTLDAVEEAGLRPEQIVFEIIESECIHDVAHFNGILDHYRAEGFGIALDDLGSGYASLCLLGEFRPDYVKLDRELMRGVCDDRFKALIAQKLLETAHALGIPAIAEGIERPCEHQWLREHGADYAQGFYFARPASPPPCLDVPLVPWSLSFQTPSAFPAASR